MRGGRRLAVNVTVCTTTATTWRLTALLLLLVVPLVVLLAGGLVSGIGSAALGFSVGGLGVGSVRGSLGGRTASGRFRDGWVSTRSITVVCRAVGGGAFVVLLGRVLSLGCVVGHFVRKTAIVQRVGLGVFFDCFSALFVS